MANVVQFRAEARVAIENLQEITTQLQQAFDKLKPGSGVESRFRTAAKQLTRAMDEVSKSVAQGFGSQKEIDTFERKLIVAKDSLQTIQRNASQIKFANVREDIISPAAMQRIKEAQLGLEQAKNNLNTMARTRVSEFINADAFKQVESLMSFDVTRDPLGKKLGNQFEQARIKAQEEIERIQTAINTLTADNANIEQMLAIDPAIADRARAMFSSLVTEGLFRKDGSFKAGVKAQLEEIATMMGQTIQETGKEIQALGGEGALTERLFGPTDKVTRYKEEMGALVPQLQAAETNLQNLGNAQELWQQRLAGSEAEVQQLKGRVTELAAEMDNLKQEIANSTVDTEKMSDATRDAAKSIDVATDSLAESKVEMKANAEAAKDAASAAKALEDIKNSVKHWMSFAMVVGLVRRGIRDAYNEIKELDRIMTDMSVVTAFTTEELWANIDANMAMAQRYGVTTAGVYQVQQLYYQQGLETAEVTELTTETLKMARIANISYAESADFMTAALRGFKLEMSEAQRITDVFSELAAISATDTNELAIALSKTASGAEAMGSTFENTTAMLALMLETTREAG